MLTYSGRISVESDWATLREVIVGRPYYRIIKPYTHRLKKMMDSEAWKTIKQEEGNLLKDAFPDLHQRAKYQMDEAAKILRRCGVIVHEVLPFDDGEDSLHGRIGSIQFFPRDVMLVVGNSRFELSLVNPLRRKELAPLRRFLLSASGSPITVHSMPGVAAPQKSHARLEGGDCLFGDNEIYVGISGNASNLYGVSWLRKVIKGTSPSCNVTPVRLSPEFPHLDMALSLLRPGLGIRCPEAFPVGLPASLATWQWVDVSKNDALSLLAVNALPLDAQTCLVVAEADKVVDTLKSLKHTVIPVPFAGVTWLGGGLRCWTQPLQRSHT
jgi:N-dimethylarginine dimethylaminohydrolase